MKVIGKRYGRLVVTDITSDARYRKCARCVCDCGNTREVRMDKLNTGRTKSCGCLQKELNATDVEKMLVSGKTDLLPGFISKKTRRAFAAHLTLDPDTAKIGFEFAPRKTAKKAAKKKE